MEEKILKGDEAIELFEKGMAEWNQWAESHSDWSVEFSDYSFPDEVSFKGFLFPGNARFVNLKFMNQAVFDDARFLRGAFFKEIIFKEKVSFNRVKFHDVTNFSFLECEKNTTFTNCFVQTYIEFSNSQFLGAVSFNSANINGEGFGCFNSQFSGGVDFRANFNQGDFFLHDSELSNANFEECNFYYGVSIKNSNFDALNCKNVSFKKGGFFSKVKVFTRADFSGVDFYSQLEENVSTYKLNFDNLNVAAFIDFTEAKFRAPVSFSNANFAASDFNNVCFEEDVKFDNCLFSKVSRFEEAVFKSSVSFKNSVFENVVDFSLVKFEAESDFSFSIFKEMVAFDSSEFESGPDLSKATFAKGASFNGADLKYRLNGIGFLGKTLSAKDEAMYRSWKVFASQAKDHESEQKYFRYELMAKRFYKHKGFSLFLNFFYGFFSDSGRSVKRPLIALITTIFIFTCLYERILCVDNTNSVMFSQFSLLFSISHALPFVSVAKSIREEMGNRVLSMEGNTEFLYLVTYAENFLGLLFVFLIGLAVRNQFKL